MSCGVVTIITPVTGTCCASVQLNISGTRRHIHDQVIEIAPIGLRQQLLQCLRDHRSAPHHRLIGVNQQADRAHLQTMVFHRLERAIVTVIGRPLMPSIVGWLGP